MRKGLGLLGIVLLMLMLVTSAFPQGTSGRLSGSVMDSSGAVVPSAKISVTNENTGAQYPVETNAEGVFLVPLLPAGYYAVRVEAPGFRLSEVRGVKVDVAAEHTLPPIRLELGGVQETVTVSAGANVVQTASAEVTSTLSIEQIKALPTAERNPLVLLDLNAGVSDTGRTARTLNGLRIGFTNVTIDGINVQDNFIRTNSLSFLPNLPFLSQVGEITVTTSNQNASHGGGAAQVAFISPSGTNAFHGEGFWTNRNNATAANDFFNNAADIDKPFLLLNQFGGSMGGPIVRDKLFFFGWYEGYRLKAGDPQNATILLPDARNGTFTYRDNSGVTRKINVLEAAGVPLDPFVKGVLDRVPTSGNFTSVGDGLNTTGFRFNQRDNRTRDNVGGKIDYNASFAHNFTGSFHWNRDIVDRPDIDGTYNVAPVVQNDDSKKLFSAAWRWTPTPHLTNEVRGGFNFAPGTFINSEEFGSFVINNAAGTSFIFTNPVEDFRNQGRETNTYTIADNLAWQKGAHSFRFGGSTQQIRVFSFVNFDTIPVYNIGISTANTKGLAAGVFPGGISAAQRNTANALLASLAGFVTSGTQGFNVTSKDSGFVPGAGENRNFSLNNYSFYGADSWKLRRNLTFNYGVRWEYIGRFDEQDGLLLHPVLGSDIIGTLLSNATVDFAGSNNGRPIYDKDLNNFGPNIGLAWDPHGDGKMAIRAGYSINFVNDDAIRAADNATLGNDGLSSSSTLVGLTNTISGGLPTLPVPEFKVPRTFTDQTELDPFAAGFAIHPKLVAPYVQQWNLAIQREFPGHTSVEIRYVGNKGTGLYRGNDFNQTEIRANGFLEDFIRARNNGFLAQAAGGAFDPRFNPNIPGSQQLTVFPRTVAGGLLTNATVRNRIETGQAGDLASIYFQNGLQGDVQFVPNEDIFVADLLGNGSNSTYHALQVEANRRFGSLFFNTNYTWSKVLTDSSGTSQARFDPFLDINNPGIEKAPAEFDLRHAFKASFDYALPLGGNSRFSPSSRVLNKIVSGWAISSFFVWQSGDPFSIVSNRGTLNRAGRSTNKNTATSTASGDVLSSITGVFRQGNGVFFVSPNAIGPDGRGVAPDGAAPFEGQVFFNPGPGTVGALQRRMFRGPRFFNWNFAVRKNTKITERTGLEFRVEFFNLPNNVWFEVAPNNNDPNVNSTTFGKLTTLDNEPRFIQTSLRFTF